MMSSSASSTKSDAASQQPEVLGRSREGMIAESMKNGEDIQKQFPSVDFKGAVIEPTVNLTFDIQVRWTNSRTIHASISNVILYVSES